MLFILKKFKFSICIALFLSLMGIVVSQFLPISLYPQISKPAVRVTIHIIDDPKTFYFNWGQQIEQAMGAVDGVEFVEATYKPNKIRLFAHFSWGISAQQAKQKIATAVAFYQAQQPKFLPPVKVDFYDPASENYVALKSDKFDQTTLSKMVRNELLPQLNKIKGVSAAWISQKTEEKVRVALRPFDLLRFNLSAEDIVQQLQDNEFDIHLGKLKTQGSGEVGVYFHNPLSSIDALQLMEVASRMGLPVTLNDVADVSLVVEQTGRFFQYEESNVVAIAVWAEPSANLYQVSEDFVATVSQYAEDKGELLILNTPKEFIEESISSMLLALSLGIGVAALVVLLFYRKLRDVLLICLSMPVTLAISILILGISGTGLNLLSLGAIGISLGMVVDSAILVIDKLNRTNFVKNTMLQQIAEAVTEVWPGIFLATLSTIIVFVPLAFTLPLVSSLLLDMVKVTVTILIISLFVNVVFLPAIFRLVCGTATKQASKNTEELPAPGLLLWLFDLPGSVRSLLLIAAFTLITLSLLHLPEKLKQEVIAQPKASIIDINVPFASDGLSDEEKIAILADLRQTIRSNFAPQIDYLYSDIRASDAYISIHLTSFKEFEYVYQRLGKLLQEQSVEGLTFSPWITSSLKVTQAPDRRLTFTAANHELNRQLLHEAHAFLASEANIARQKLYPKLRKVTRLTVDMDQQLSGRILSESQYSSTQKDFLQFVRYAIEPEEQFNIRLAEQNIPLQVSVQRNIEQASSINAIPTELNGNPVFFNDVLQFSEQKQWREYFSRDAKLTYMLDIWFKGASPTGQEGDWFARLKTHLNEKLEMEYLPIVIEDTGLETRQALSSLLIALCLSIALVFLLCLLQYSSIRQSLILLFAIPSGIAGAVMSLYWFDSTLSLNAMLGMLIIVGLSVNNAIIIMEGFQQTLKQRNLPVSEVLARVVRQRIRPVAVTNLTTIFCMLPLAIGIGAGQDILKPLGISVVGGLLISTLLTMLMVPLALSFSKAKKPEYSRQPVSNLN